MVSKPKKYLDKLFQRKVQKYAESLKKENPCGQPNGWLILCSPNGR